MTALKTGPNATEAMPDAAETVAPSILVLVVDDDDLVRGVLTEMLEEDKFSVIEASSGVEALNLIRSRSDLDLVISDVNMPEMDGLKLFEEVKSVRPSLPVVLMSGRRLPNADRSFLPKPFTRQDLLACIDRIGVPVQRPASAPGALSALASR